MNNPSTTQPVVYHTSFNQTRYLTPITPGSGPEHPLPDSLVLKPAIYQYQGRSYDLTQEGMYRFSLPLVDNQQRIVFAGDLGIMLSSLSWIFVHGFSDRGLPSVEEALTQALTRKLRLSCGFIHSLATTILTNLGFRVHQVEGQAVTGRGDYDGDGHTALEAYHPGMKQWVFCDLDKKALVTRQGQPLAFLDMAQALAREEPVEVTFLSPASRYDLSDINEAQTGFDFTFMCEAVLTPEGLLQWYRRVFQVPLVGDHKGRAYLFTDQEHRRLIESISPVYKWVTPQELQRRVYGDAALNASKLQFELEV